MEDFSYPEEISNSDANDIDAQLHFQIITDENERLKTENHNLKFQFDQAINIRKELDKLHSENLELLTKLKTTESEKEDLEKRIQLNLTSFHDQIEKSKNDYAVRLSNAYQEINNLQEQIALLKKEKELTPKEDESKIQEIIYKIDAETKKRQELQEKLKQIIDGCSSFFHIAFPSSESILNYFATNPTPNSQDQNNSFTNNDEIQYMQTIKKLSNKIHREQNKRKSIQKQLSDSVTQFQSTRSNYESQLNAAKRELNELKGKIQRDELFHQQVVKQLEENLKKAREETSSKKYECSLLDSFVHQKINQKQSQSFQSEQSDDKKTDEYKKMKKQLLACIKKLRDRLSNIQIQLSQSENTNNQLVEEISKLKESCSDLQRKLESKTNELDVQLKQNDFLEKERKAIQNELVKITTQTENEENKKIIELQRKIDEFENINENIKKENSSYCDQIKQLKSQISSIQNDLRTKIDDLNQSQQSLQDAKSENQNLRSKLNSIPKPININEVIPKSCFICQNAPLSLAQSLSDLSSKEHITPAAKISMSLSLVQSYYSKQIESQNSLIQEMKNDSNYSKQLKSAIDSFVTQFQKMDQIYNDVDELSNILSQFRINYEKLDSENKVNQQILKDFGAKLNIPDDQLSFNSLISFANRFIELQECFTNKSAKLKSVKKQKKMINEKANNEIEILQTQLFELQSQKKEMENEITEKAENIHKLEIQNQEISFKLKETEDQIETLKQTQENDIIQLKNQASQEFESARDSFIKDIEEKDAQIQKLKKKIESCEKAKSLLRKGICLLKKKLKQSMDLNSEQKRINDEEKKKLIKKIDDEKIYIQKVNNDTVQKLRDQCSELRLSLTKLNEALKESEDKNCKYHKEINNLKRQKQKLEEQLSIQKDSIERERKIMDSKLHSALLNADMKTNNQILNIKSKIEGEKQKIIAYFAEEFRAFFDPKEQIDMNTYQSLVQKARNELTKLQNSDNAIRRLTNASSYQSTEEAVAQLVFKSKQQFDDSFV